MEDTLCKTCGKEPGFACREHYVSTITELNKMLAAAEQENQRQAALVTAAYKEVFDLRGEPRCCELEKTDGVPGWWHCLTHGRRKSLRKAEVDELVSAIINFKNSPVYRDFNGHPDMLELMAAVKKETS